MIQDAINELQSIISIYPQISRIEIDQNFTHLKLSTEHSDLSPAFTNSIDLLEYLEITFDEKNLKNDKKNPNRN
ncbi:hypothetical protein [Tenacibaculum maritimum]|uniref:hypothetical protein n=1 Tax=Tenacibaculum maritimum TaxID=107401 RepID=UPI0012E49FB5|nr:hypothetical protein [Tenacibaculum maritimum]CAA0152468.1 hypothetical protein TMP227_100029 [Tenacibaculum maritimum]